MSESSSVRWNVLVVWLITECFFYFSVVCVYVYCDFIARFRYYGKSVGSDAHEKVGTVIFGYAVLVVQQCEEIVLMTIIVGFHLIAHHSYCLSIVGIVFMAGLYCQSEVNISPSTAHPRTAEYHRVGLWCFHDRLVFYRRSGNVYH